MDQNMQDPLEGICCASQVINILPLFHGSQIAILPSPPTPNPRRPHKGEIM